MDRRQAVEFFRQRLMQVIEQSGMSQTAFAEAVRIDRSTLSQLLAPGNDRLPRVETLVAIASHRRCSLDWLLGLSQKDQFNADIVPESVQIEPNAPSPVDERLVRWHLEAAGYKIRHVPTTFPDFLKTEPVIRFEYEHFAALGPERGIENAHSELAYLRRPETDMEACSPLQSVAGFARGEGAWNGLPRIERRAQLRRLIDLVAELYPTFRWFLYDDLRVYSAPVTIYGPLRAALYIGQAYLVFSSTEHIRALTRHFDALVRAAAIQPTELTAHLETLLAEVS
jgi:transcriptional regulator with XRE-family HTH domain